MEEKAYENITVKKNPLEPEGEYMGLITFNRPKEMNPLDWSTVKELREAFNYLADEKSVRVIALTGSGRAFSAGGDLKGYLTLMRDDKGFREFLNDIGSTLNYIQMISQPVISLVNGYCVAGGIELLLACDFAYASKSAKIGDGHVNFGQIGGAGSNIRLPRWIPPPKARELLYTGKLLSAEEALQWGLVNRVVDDDKLLEAGLEFANETAKKSPLGLGIIKRVCNQGLSMPLEDALKLEIEEVHHYALTSNDCREGLLAFSEKRKPDFKGR